MRKTIDGQISPVLLGSAVLFLLGSLFTLDLLGIVDLPALWHYWMLLLVVIG